MLARPISIWTRYVTHVDWTIGRSGRSTSTGVGASVRMNGDAGYVYSGSTGASFGSGRGVCSLTWVESKAYPRHPRR